MSLARVSRLLCRLAAVAGTSLTMLASGLPAGAAAAQRPGPNASSPAFPALGQWQPASSYAEPSATSDQGLATVAKSKGSPTIVYRGDYSIPPNLFLQGWQHIGDPGAGGSPRGYLYDAYQGSSTATSKLYEITTPTGATYDFVHPLATLANEDYNNSFSAVSPDGQWMVSGEWGDMNRLLVFPTPLLNPSAPATGQQTMLYLSGVIALNQTVRNVQGCDFVTNTTLLCSSDDPNAQDLLQVDLSAPLSGATAEPATVKPLGALPRQSSCTGTFEVEGIDYYASSKQMRVEVIPPSPCDVSTTVYVYRKR